jgi:hypothetical protein
MHYAMLKAKVEDFNKWKPVFDENESFRQAAGLRDVSVLRNIDNPNEIVLLFEASDLTKAKNFTNSDELKERMKQSGVLGRPEFIFLSDK